MHYPPSSGFKGPRRQLRWLGWVSLVAFLPVVLGMVLAQWAADRKGISLAMFTREPATALKGKYYVGFISNIGVLLWCVTAVTCLFTSAVLRGTTQRGLCGFLFFAGLLSTCLMIDDCFMLHDGMLWALARIPEKAVVGTWGIGGLLWLIVYRRTILRTDFLLVALAGVFFAMSLIADQESLPIPQSRRHLVEDGSKLLGITAWGVYLCRISYDAVRAALSKDKQDAATA